MKASETEALVALIQLEAKRQLRLALGGLLEVERFANILNQRYSAALKEMP